MARSVAEIKKVMTDAFMREPEVQRQYDLREGDVFEDKFSKVSIENLLFFVVASAHYVLERIFEQFRHEVNERITHSVVATIPWYHAMALAYQEGDSLVLDEKLLRWRYRNEDEGKRLVRYVAVSDLGGSIQILVSKDNKGLPEALTEDELRGFKAYMNAIKIAGVVLSIRSLPADELHLSLKVQTDPLVFLPSGIRWRDGSRPVEEAIRSYLKGITYGGVFNKTKLVDAIQAVEGVIDIEVGECYGTPYLGSSRLIKGNNYKARSGSFIAPKLSETIAYHY